AGPDEGGTRAAFGRRGLLAARCRAFDVTVSLHGRAFTRDATGSKTPAAVCAVLFIFYLAPLLLPLASRQPRQRGRRHSYEPVRVRRASIGLSVSCVWDAFRGPRAWIKGPGPVAIEPVQARAVPGQRTPSHRNRGPEWARVQ